MQKERGTLPLAIYTASEHDIMEERQNVIQDIAAMQPNHDERVLSIQVSVLTLSNRKATQVEEDEWNFCN